MEREYNIQDFIPATEHKQKKPKKAYQKPEAVKQLEADYMECKYRGRSIPEEYRIKTKFRDETANGLVGCLDAWCKVNGAFFQRNNSQGQYDSRIGIWRRSGSTKGIADCQVVHGGKTYNFEIKIGRDRQSDVQKKVEASIKAAGGHYAVIRNYMEFLNEIEK